MKVEKSGSIIKGRSPGLDLVRCFAFLCVISVHFFSHSGFYEETIAGPYMFILVSVRNFFMVSVPLFIMLSGYLLGERKATGRYYLRIIQILSIYLMASFLCALYKAVFKPEDFSITSTIVGIFNYKTAPYGWYIGMYIGLFMLIPYINAMYSNLPSHKSKKILVISLLVMTAGPSLFNDYFPVFPEFWMRIYPITYYIIGCYIKEYPLKIKWTSCILLMGGVLLLAGALSYFSSYGGKFLSNKLQGHETITTAAQTILVFHLITQRNYDRMGEKMRKFLSQVSNCCLGAYLVSWIFDSIFHGILTTYQTTVLGRSKYFLPIILAVYICSLLVSAVLNLVYNHSIKRIVNWLIVRHELKKAA